MLEIACDTSIVSESALASKWRVSRRQLARYKKTAAWCLMRCQIALASFLLHMAVGCRMVEPRRPAFDIACDDLMADETQQRLLLSLGQRLLASQCVGAPHVFIAYRECTVVKDGQELLMNWISPPVASLGTDAGSMVAILHEIPGLWSHRHYSSWFNKVGHESRWTLKRRSLDGAGGCSRYRDWEVIQDSDKPTVLGLYGKCLLHNNNLGATNVSVQVFPNLQESMFCCSKFLTMGGSIFLRLLYATKDLVDTRAHRSEGPRPALYSTVATVLVGLLILMHVRSVMPVDMIGRKGASWLDDLLFCFSVFSGCLVATGAASELWEHICPGPHCCTHIGQTKERMYAVLLRVCLRCRPMVNTLSRWHTTGPALDFYLLTICLCRVT